MPERDDIHEHGQDPMDEAYRRAERAQDDEAARAARRARVLAAVTEDAETPPAPVLRRPVRRYGGWLAAAGVAGLSLWTAQKVYRPAPPPPTPQEAPAAVTPVAPTVPAPPAKLAPSPSAKPRASSAPPRIVAHRRSAIAEPIPAARPADIAPPPPLPLPPVEKPLAQAPAFASPPPPPVAAAPALVAAPPPAPALAAKPGNATQETVVVTGSRIQRRGFAATAPAVISGPLVKVIDGDTRLREAAAAGRSADIEALLAEGVPVDSPDDEGETALMKSIEAGQSGAAGLLRRHGASLDQKNRAGLSARDMAAKKDDAELDEALGLSR